MFSESSNQIQLMGATIARILRDLVDILARIARLEQQPWAAGASAGSGGSGGGGFFVCYPAGAVAAAEWTSGVPTAGAAFTATVYQCSYSGGSQTITNLGSKNCVNWIPSGLQASKAVILQSDGAGSYGVVSQSCS